LFYPIDKQGLLDVDQNNNCNLDMETLPHPSIIALIMRRSSGIQALECHVFIARSTCDAESIVNLIRSSCSIYKQQQNKNNSDLFHYNTIQSESSQTFTLPRNELRKSHEWSINNENNPLMPAGNFSFKNKTTIFIINCLII
jgi:hypothetical protein